jgi:hypothetical protein
MRKMERRVAKRQEKIRRTIKDGEVTSSMRTMPPSLRDLLPYWWQVSLATIC